MTDTATVTPTGRHPGDTVTCVCGSDALNRLAVTPTVTADANVILRHLFPPTVTYQEDPS